MEQKRSSFTGKIGFVLAAAGSAVGLGNIWRFPYLAAKYGGGMFLLTYILLAITFGFSLMIAEIAIGRKTSLSAIGAFRSFGKKFAFIGYLCALVPALILPYYSVIGGWVMKYLTVYLTGDGMAAAQNDYFGNFIASPQTILWFCIFLAITALVVLFGVEKGIEKVSKIMMPVLILLSLFIAIYSCTLKGAGKGLLYYITPNFSNFSIMTVVAAVGQLFYSMSLAMGIMITYGSYMKKDVSLESSVRQIELFDTGIAFLAGLMVIPAVFVFSGGDPAALGAGPGLMFITLPKVFASMTGGAFVAALFFVLVLFAALTSSISLMETVVSIVQDCLHWNRRLSCLVVFVGCILLGIPSALGYGVWESVTILGLQFLDFFDFITNSVLMPITALIICLFLTFITRPKMIIDEVESCGSFRAKKLFLITIQYIAPFFLLAILISSVLSTFGVISI